MAPSKFGRKILIPVVGLAAIGGWYAIGPNAEPQANAAAPMAPKVVLDPQLILVPGTCPNQDVALERCADLRLTAVRSAADPSKVTVTLTNHAQSTANLTSFAWTAIAGQANANGSTCRFTSDLPPSQQLVPGQSVSKVCDAKTNVSFSVSATGVSAGDYPTKNIPEQTATAP